MKIQRINTFPVSSKNKTNKKQNNNTVRNTNTAPSFKGYFHEMSQYAGMNNKKLIIDGRIMDYEYTRNPKGFDYICYSYIADPGEKDEDIPQSAIDLTVCTIHTEMPFSWIRDNYKNGYKNFANNAYREMNYFGDKIKAEEKEIELINKNKSKFIEMHEQCKLKRPDDFEKLVTACIPARLRRFDKKTAEKQELIKNIEKKRNLANQRFELLCELDGIGGEKQSMIDEQKRIHLRKSDIERILHEKSGHEYNTLSRERQILEDHLTAMDRDFANIDKRLDNTFRKVENFYKEKYPDLYRL